MQRRSYLSHLSVFKYNKDQEDLFNMYISKETALLEFWNTLDRNDQLILLTFVESDPIKLLAILSKNMSIDKIKNLTQPYAQKYLRQLHGNMYKKLQAIRNNKETSTFGNRIQFEIQNPEISDEWIKWLLDFPTSIKYPYLKECVNFSIKWAGQIQWDYKNPSLEDLEIGGNLFKAYTNSNDAGVMHPFLSVTDKIQKYIHFWSNAYADIKNDQQFYEIFEIAHKIIVLNHFIQKINSNLLDEFQEKFKLCQNSNDLTLKPAFHQILLDADKIIKIIRKELQVNDINIPTLVSWQLNKIFDLKKNEKPKVTKKQIQKKQPTFDPKSTRLFPQFIYEHLKQLKSQDFPFWSSVQNEIQDSSQVTEDWVKWILGLESPIQDKTGVLKKLVYNSIQLINTKLHKNSTKIKEWQNIFTLYTIKLKQIPAPPFLQLIKSAQNYIKEVESIRQPLFQKKIWPWWKKHLTILKTNLLFQTVSHQYIGRRQFKFKIFQNRKKWLKKRMFTLYNIFLSHLNHKQDRIWGKFFSTRKYTKLINIKTRFLYTLRYFFKKINRKQIYTYQNKYKWNKTYTYNILNFEIMALIIILRSKLMTKIAQSVHFFKYGFVHINEKINKDIISIVDINSELMINSDLILDFKIVNWIELRDSLFIQVKTHIPHWLEVSSIISTVIIWVGPTYLDFKNYQLSLWNSVILSKQQKYNLLLPRIKDESLYLNLIIICD